MCDLPQPHCSCPWQLLPLTCGHQKQSQLPWYLLPVIRFHGLCEQLFRKLVSFSGNFPFTLMSVPFIVSEMNDSYLNWVLL